MMLFLLVLVVFVGSVAIGTAIGSALGNFVLESRMRDERMTASDDVV